MNRRIVCLLVAIAIFVVAMGTLGTPLAYAHRWHVAYYVPAPGYAVTYTYVPRRAYYVAPVVPAPVVYLPTVGVPAATYYYPPVYGVAPVVFYGW